ncbi:hypothetical protein CPLU01_07389 [Colletotrichum plurivorum]|uniref:Uncharacterized protein n=1 Tax=Colletotrichum plurivorum TaxID=2175906 RepID=A0A8H6KEW0_9PEZI|nr:hypothetical protein CPLU01_07389 [Colletotrichum plurivorum]
MDPQPCAKPLGVTNPQSGTPAGRGGRYAANHPRPLSLCGARLARLVVLLSSPSLRAPRLPGAVAAAVAAVSMLADGGQSQHEIPFDSGRRGKYQA